MDPNATPQEYPPAQSFDTYHSFGSNAAPVEQDSSARFRPQGHYQGPYPTSNPRMRQHGDFQPRGRFMHNRRGGHRPQNRFRQNFDQQSQASNNPDGQATTTYANNRGFNKYFRPSMLEDPWANMTPQKVPSNGTSLVFDTAN